MQSVDRLLNGRWLIPVSPNTGVLENHSVAIKDDKIVAILPTQKAQTELQSQEVIDLPSHAIMPGLINAHTHAAMTLMRGMADDLPLMTWLNHHIWPAEATLVDSDYVGAGSDLAILEMLRSGITAFNDMYFFPEATIERCQASGYRAIVGMIILDFPSTWAKNADEYLTKGQALFQRHSRHPLTHFALAPHAPYTVSPATLDRVNELSQDLNLPIHMHVHETEAEVEQAKTLNGCRPIEGLNQRNLLSNRLVAVHMTQLNEAEIDLIAKHNVHVVHCPESNLKLASGFCPVSRLLDAGVNVAIGTDGAASNNDLDLFGEMRTAGLLGKSLAKDASVLPASQLIEMATINAATALGLDDQIGSIEIGKQADLIAINLQAPETQPLYEPLSQIVYAASRQQVSHVWIAGQPMLHERQSLTLDVERIVANAQNWAKKIAKYRHTSEPKLA